MGTPLSFSLQQIMECQRNRYPMLFIDFVEECVPGQFARGRKLFTINEWFFHGYETAEPKVWNAIQIEAMSQMFLMTFLSLKEVKGSVAMSSKFDNVNFFKKIEPGDVLDIDAQLKSFRHGVARGSVEGRVNGDIACNMECTILVPDSLRIPVSPKKDEPRSMVPHLAPQNSVMGTRQIRECLLNIYPWLLIDKVLEITPGERLRAIKNFTYNEHFFPDHFPGDPSVPGFIQIECCMQAFLLSFLSLDGHKRSETADRALDKVRLRRKIIPGEQLELGVVLESFRRGVAKGSVEGFVNGEPAISLEATVVIPDAMVRLKPN